MIPARFRAALCAKGALLAALFVWLGVAAWARGASYSVVYGRHSGVLVRPPEREHAPSTLPRVR